MNKEDLAVGQAMVVWSGVHKRVRHDARVAKIARKYVTIEVWRGPEWTIEIEFDIETQKERGNTSHYAAVFRTTAQQEYHDRNQAAQDALRELRLATAHDIMTNHPLERVEAIIALVRQWDELVGVDDAEADDPGEEARS